MTARAPGRFITLEGGEGVGKSTQMRALAAILTARGLEVVTTREPGGSPGAELIRTLLLDNSVDAWSPATEALLFAAARSDHSARVIKPSLARGAWVLCDRFVDSTRAYQGAQSGENDLSDVDIMTLHRIGSGGLLPDRTLLLTLDAAVAAKRRQTRDAGTGDRFERRDAAFHDAVARRFLALAAHEPDRIRIIDASGDSEALTAKLTAALDDLL